jgi:hypothetical protein
MVSADDEGYIVLWNVRKETPIRVFRVAGDVGSIAMFGEEFCEALYVQTDNKVLRIHLQSVPKFKRAGGKAIDQYRQSVAAQRETNRRKFMRTKVDKTSQLGKKL